MILGDHVGDVDASAGHQHPEQRGRWAFYRVVDDTLRSLGSALVP